jgi:hypothetical protein
MANGVGEFPRYGEVYDQKTEAQTAEQLATQKAQAPDPNSLEAKMLAEHAKAGLGITPEVQATIDEAKAAAIVDQMLAPRRRENPPEPLGTRIKNAVLRRGKGDNQSEK